MFIFSIIFFALCFSASLILLLHKNKSVNKKRRYSILIACRNEEHNVIQLIDSLNKINYPKDLFEAIIVDDASSDSTWKKLQFHHSNNIKTFRLEHKSKEYKGKKAALKFAAESAEFEYFLFTDADCILPEDILNSYNKVITEETDAVIGWYKTHNAGNLQNVIDFTTAVIFALSVYLKKPFSASGMNWLITKKAFHKVKGYETIKHELAGDDKLLLNLVVKSGGKVDYNCQCPVVTKLDEEMNLHRLMRKYGKFSSNPLPHKIFIIFIGLYLILIPVSVYLGTFLAFIFYAAGLIVLWISSCFSLKHKLNFKELFCFLAFPYIALYLTVRGSFGNWEWKGQQKK